MSVMLSSNDTLDEHVLGATGALSAPCESVEARQTPLRASVATRVLGGTSALGLSVLIERGAGFGANLLAARLGGAATFGAYSLALSTASQISTYAAGGIGATAARFSGKYARGCDGYPLLARALITVSLVSAIIAAVGLWFGAGPIAHLLGKRELTLLLRAGCLSAGGMIMLECARGFFVGQRRLAALILLAALVGTSLLTLLPVAARHHDPVRMILLQGAITTTAVVLCLLLARPLGLTSTTSSSRRSMSLPAMLREVSIFGLVQLAGLVLSNAAGWWLTALIARSDTSLVQMSFFAIASQLRNLAGIAPGLLTEGSYAVMADPHGEATRTPHHVMEVCTFASLTVSLTLAALGMMVVPWGVTLLYGRTYTNAGLAVAAGLATAVVHMGNAPASARLTIVSLRAMGIINTVWAVVVACSATAFLFFGGGAAEAMLIYFSAHLLSAGLVLLVLRRKDGLHRSVLALYALTSCSILALLALAGLRSTHAQLTAQLTALMLATTACTLYLLIRMGKRFHWLPSANRVQELWCNLQVLLPGRQAHV